MTGDRESEPRQADRVYAKPSSAEAEALEVLDDESTSVRGRAEALATLGRAAYYDNRIDDAVAYLERALPIADDAALTAHIVLTLAPALSKIGRAEDAVQRLDFDVRDLSIQQQGKVENQRGIILVETGRLQEALDSFRRARELHHAEGDAASEGRVLVNMAAAASEIGELAQAEQWYAEAWDLNRRSGQDFACAIIEGNLGYVASRRGDFSAALEWYERGRASFSDLGDVDLLVAVLETDHATTLLDLGMYAAALEAATYALSSSTAGSNRMLEVQARLLCGEAELGLGQLDAAAATLDRVNAAAEELEVAPLRLRSEYLRFSTRARAEGYELDATVGLAQGLQAAGWHREALRTLLTGARLAVDAGDTPGALTLLELARAVAREGADPIDAAHAEGLLALLNGNEQAFDQALLAGEAELERQRHLLTTAELQVRLGHRQHALRELALRRALGTENPHEVLDTLDGLVTSGRRATRETERTADLRSQLRDVRVGIQEAQLSGKPIASDLERLEALESELLVEAAPQSARARGPASSLLPSAPDLPIAQYFEHRGELLAVTIDGDVTLTELGPSSALRSPMRAQRSALRRMAAGDEAAPRRAEEAGERLQQLLIDPLPLEAHGPLGIVGTPSLAGLVWSGVTGLRERPLVLASSPRSLLRPDEPLQITSAGFLSAGGLAAAPAEVEAVADVWTMTDRRVMTDGSRADAVGLLRTVDLCHVSTHGTFRTDNPLFTSLEFADGQLSLLEIEDEQRMPALIVLGACDSAASSQLGAELVGTTETLLSLGTRVVCAASLIVDDAATARLLNDLHEGLAGGASPIEAMQEARMSGLQRETPEDVAAALSFAVHGDSAALVPLAISRI